MQAKDILTIQGQMQTEKNNWNNLAQETADYFAPEYADIITERSGGLPLHDKIFEAKAGEALDVWVALLNFMLTPRNREWHKLKAKNEDLNKDNKISQWLESATKRIFKKRYAPIANFASQVDKFYFSDGLFGNSCLYVDSEDLQNIRYKNIHPKEIFFKENHQGGIGHLHRMFKLTSAQAVKKFGEDKLPKQIVDEAMDVQKSVNKHEFIHAVFENDDYDPNSLSPDKKRLKSCYVSCTGQHKISESGYNTMPYIVSRHKVALNEIYGRSPAMKILPTVKSSNFMKKTMMRVAGLIADPPYISTALADMPPFSMMSGAINYGYLADNGTPSIQPMPVGGKIDHGLQMIEDLRKDIASTFFMNIYQILVETPQMTATEVMQRAQEKAILLTPTMGSKQNDFLGVLIERELDVMNSMGLFDDMPDELRVNDGVAIEYDTEMTRMMRADEGVGIMRTLEIAMQVSQADPNVLQVFDLPETLREISEINGVPAKLLRPKEEIEAMQEQAQQQNEMAQMAQMAGTAAPALRVANDAGML